MYNVEFQNSSIRIKESFNSLSSALALIANKLEIEKTGIYSIIETTVFENSNLLGKLILAGYKK
jgi:hypothetical protein